MAYRISVSGTAIISCVACAVPGELILDTGPFVALVDRSETRHRDFSIYRHHGDRPFRLLPG